MFVLLPLLFKEAIRDHGHELHFLPAAGTTIQRGVQLAQHWRPGIFTGILVLWNVNGALIIGACLQDYERSSSPETLSLIHS